MLGRKKLKQDDVLGETYLTVGTQAWADDKEKLARNFATADMQASKFFADMDLWNAAHGHDPNGMERQVDIANRAHGKLLMAYCVAPLRQGDSHGVVSTLGRATLCYAFSKNFRKECKQDVENLIYPFVKKRAEKAGPDSDWARKRDEIIRNANGGRLPLTARSAAVLQIGLMQKAYADMRKPGADVEQVKKDYKKYAERLRGIAQTDGISNALLDKTVRIMVGKYAREDPSQKAMFSQFAEGAVRMSDPLVVEIDGKERSIWRGEFEYRNGTPFHRGFDVRAPRTAEQHVRSGSADMKEALSRCESWDDVKSMYDTGTGSVRTDFDEDMAERMSWRQELNRMDAVSQEDMKARENAWSEGWTKAVEKWLEGHPDARPTAERDMDMFRNRSAAPDVRAGGIAQSDPDTSRRPLPRNAPDGMNEGLVTSSDYGIGLRG